MAAMKPRGKTIEILLDGREEPTNQFAEHVKSYVMEHNAYLIGSILRKDYFCV